MIHTAKQLKDKVKNMSGGNSEVAQALIRIYFMERFLERVSVSEYRNNFILKGGMLVASIVGVDMRATMDIDTTVKALPLNEKPRIFDMFYSGANQIADSRRSLGLGLSLCKSIINAHGGELTVSDNLPHGTVFTFTLPAGEVKVYE